MIKVLLFAILALSMNAFAQTEHPISNLKEGIQISLNERGLRNKDGIWNTPDISSRMNLVKAIKHQTSEQRDLIQIFDSIHYWQWDTLSIGWKIYAKIINIVYDAENNLISQEYQYWNGTAWMITSQSIFTYNINNNLTSELYQNWNDNTWVNYSQYICTYDANNNLTIELYQIWNGITWWNSLQYIYTYDANNNLTRFLNQDWYGSTWVNYSQHIYSYDANNNRTCEGYWGERDSGWKVCKTIKSTVFPKSFNSKKLDIS